MMNFNSKETYLAARAQWTADYLQLTTDIRKARGALAETQREAAKHSLDRDSDSSTKAAYYDAVRHVRDALYNLQVLRQKANESLQELSVAKEEANRQWLASRARMT